MATAQPSRQFPHASILSLFWKIWMEATSRNLYNTSMSMCMSGGPGIRVRDPDFIVPRPFDSLRLMIFDWIRQISCGTILLVSWKVTALTFRVYLESQRYPNFPYEHTSHTHSLNHCHRRIRICIGIFLNSSVVYIDGRDVVLGANHVVCSSRVGRPFARSWRRSLRFSRVAYIWIVVAYFFSCRIYPRNYLGLSIREMVRDARYRIVEPWGNKFPSHYHQSMHWFTTMEECQYLLHHVFIDIRRGY